MTYPTTALIQMPISDYDTHIERERLEATASATAELGRLREQLKQAMADNETLTRENTQQRVTISDLQATVAGKDLVIIELKKKLDAALPPLDDTGVVVIDPDPLIKPRPVFPFCGLYFEDKRPSDSVDDQAQAKEHADAMIPEMEFAADSAIGDYIFHVNWEDLKHGGIVRTAARLGKRWWQSPIQVNFDKPAQQIEHLKRLHDAGVYGVVIDDAQNFTSDDIKIMLERIEKNMPGAPVIASFAASFDDSAFPKSRYIDSRQFFTRDKEKEDHWFPKWEQAQDAQIYTADCWRRGSGFMHTPERMRQAFEIALPMVQGVAFYSMMNKNWNHMTEHLAAKAKDKDALTVWDVMRDCSAIYAAKFEATK